MAFMGFQTPTVNHLLHSVTDENAARLKLDARLNFNELSSFHELDMPSAHAERDVRSPPAPFYFTFLSIEPPGGKAPLDLFRGHGPFGPGASTARCPKVSRQGKARLRPIPHERAGETFSAFPVSCPISFIHP